MGSINLDKVPPRVSSIPNDPSEMVRDRPPLTRNKMSTDSRVPISDLRGGSPCSQNDTDASTMSKSSHQADNEGRQPRKLKRSQSKRERSEPPPRKDIDEHFSRRGLRETAKKYLPGMSSGGQKMALDPAKDQAIRKIPASLQAGPPTQEVVNEVIALRKENEQLKERLSQVNKIPVTRNDSEGVNTSDLMESLTLQQPADIRLITLRREEWDFQQNQLKDAKEQLELYQAKMDEVYDELNSEKTRRVDAVRKTKATLKELASVTKTEGNFFDDNHFRDAVIKLRYDIRGWARNQAWQEQQLRPRESSKVLRPYNFLRDVSYDYVEYIKSSKTLSLIMEAFLWQYLLREVFGRYVWVEAKNPTLYGLNGRAANAMAQWKDTLEEEFSDDEPESYELFQNWRVAACRILVMRSNVDIPAAVKKMLEDIGKILRPICIDGVLDENGLMEIFRDSINLDLILQQQKPDYNFYPKFSRHNRPEHQAYQPNSMEVENEEDLAEIPEHLRRVKLVIQPSLRKYGNSAGRNYQDGFSVLGPVVHVALGKF